MTFHDYFAKAQSIKGLDKALWPVLKSITSAAVKVSHDLQKAALLDGVLGAQGEQNVQGEEQQKLDVIADIAFINAFEDCGSVACLLYTSPSPRDMRRSRMPSSA